MSIECLIAHTVHVHVESLYSKNVIIASLFISVCVCVCVCVCVRACVRVQSEEEEEEMPREAKRRMRNIGKDTPTSSGPNSFGKTARGFTDALGIYKKEQIWS